MVIAFDVSILWVIFVSLLGKKWVNFMDCCTNVLYTTIFDPETG